MPLPQLMQVQFQRRNWRSTQGQRSLWEWARETGHMQKWTGTHIFGRLLSHPRNSFYSLGRLVRMIYSEEFMSLEILLTSTLSSRASIGKEETSCGKTNSQDPAHDEHVGNVSDWKWKYLSLCISNNRCRWSVWSQSSMYSCWMWSNTILQGRKGSASTTQRHGRPWDQKQSLEQNFFWRIT